MFNHNDKPELATYLREIGKYQILNEQEEREYLRLYKEEGDLNARTILINSNLRLVVSIAKQYPRVANCETLDVIQEGNMGLIKGIESFDISRGTRLSTYATHWIRQTISKFYAMSHNDIRTPISQQKRIRQIQQCYQNKESDSGKTLSVKEIAQKLGYTEKTVVDSLEAVNRKEVFSYNVIIDGNSEKGNSNNRSVLAQLINPSAPNPEDVITKESQSYQIEELLFTVLNEREESIIRYRFGMDDGAERTLEDIARIFGLTRERVLQIEKKAIEKLNKEFNSQQIRSYAEFYYSS